MNPKKIVRKVVPKKAVQSLERGYRQGRAHLWQARYGYPSKSLKMIAITGTNGKTTSASFVNSVLKAGGIKTAVYTTAFFEIDGQNTPNHTHMTVAGQKSIQEFFSKAKQAGVEWVILEVTSHALDQSRIAGLKPDIGIVTNLTQEHLDYHGTMEKYAEAKALLFTKYGAKTAILNRDDEWFDFFASRVPGKLVSLGERDDSLVRAENIELSAVGTDFLVKTGTKKSKFHTNLIGKFNVYNALVGIAVGEELGIAEEQIAKGINALQVVPGRMEKIDEGQDFTVLVDFAITPDALENALISLKPLTNGKIRIVFGATGDRDKTKRAPMGKVVGKFADAIYLTDDETYTEDPASIRDMVYEGIKQSKAENNTNVIDDRKQAIKQAFAEAKAGDTVLLTGIGHENYRNMGGKKEPWDERQIARQLLN